MKEIEYFWGKKSEKSGFFSEILKEFEDKLFNAWEIPRSVTPVKKLEKKKKETKAKATQRSVLEYVEYEGEKVFIDPSAFCRGASCNCSRGLGNWTEESSPKEWEKVLNIWKNYD